MMTYPTRIPGHRESKRDATMSTVAFGPCWCRAVPGTDGSFDVFRHRSVAAPLGRDVLVVSDRVPPSGVPTVRRLLDGLTDPIVVSTRACPSAGWYWEKSPSGWTDIGELVDVDVAVEACLTGHPEMLFGALLELGHLIAGERMDDLSEAI